MKERYLIQGRKNVKCHEDHLIFLAMAHKVDEIANYAMTKLRERYDKTYFWCEDCDGVVLKKTECCLFTC